MPFLTEELWQRLRTADNPASIALAQYPLATGHWPLATDFDHLQRMITLARTMRAELVPGNTSQFPCEIFARGAAYEVANSERNAIERLANVRLDLHEGAAPKLHGAVRSTPEFDLILHLPEADIAALLAKLRKENDQLTKLVANSKRQLQNEEFMRKAPEKVVTQIREKLAGYQAQLAKNTATLEALA
jgi:valyl-tRNA synthetase